MKIKRFKRILSLLIAITFGISSVVGATPYTAPGNSYLRPVAIANTQTSKDIEKVLNPLPSAGPFGTSGRYALIKGKDAQDKSEISRKVFSRPYVIVMDIGGTYFRAGLFTPDSKLLEDVYRKQTPNFINHPDLEISKLQNLLVEKIVDVVNQIRLKHKDININSVGIAFAGPINKQGVVKSAATIWGDKGHNFPLKAELEKRLNLNWVVINDISGSATRYGNMAKYKEYERINVITISSGIGNKVFDVTQKKLVIDREGLGGEMGHIRVDFSEGAPICDCGGLGHLGAVASGRAAERLARKLAGEDKKLYKNSKIFKLSKGDPDNITTFHIAEAAKSKDAFALKILDKVAFPLAQAILQLTAAIGVEKHIIIGGFALGVGPPYLDSLKENMVKIGSFGRSKDEIRSLVEFGIDDDDSSLIGVGLHVQQQEGLEEGVHKVRDRIGNSAYRVVAHDKVDYVVANVDGILDVDNPTLAEYCGDKRVTVAVDHNVYNIYGSKIKEYFDTHKIPAKIFPIEETEQNKKIETVLEICKIGKDFNMDRRSIFIAIGGGIVMDLVGLSATLYRRRVPFIRIPTTLLGIVDAAIGIKTGVNFWGGKNFLGSFYPQIAVLSDLSFCQTLSKRELRCGICEIIKMGIIGNRELFEMVERHYQDILEKDLNEDVKWIIDTSIRDILERLQPNLYEENLKRLVDFGHGFGPIFETRSNFELAHGEAISIAMALCAYIAYKRGLCPEDEFLRILKLFKNVGLPLYHRCCDDVEEIYEGVNEIVLHRGGSLNLPIPLEIGKAKFVDKVEYDEIRDGLRFLKDYDAPKRMSMQEFLKAPCDSYQVALKADEPYSMSIGEYPYPECGRDEAIVKILYAGICGTDIQFYKGQRDFNPHVLGHECIAKVIEVGSNVEGVKVGDFLTINPNSPLDQDEILGYSREGIFRTIYKISDSLLKNNQVFVLPENISNYQAILAEPLACTIKGQGIIGEDIAGKTVAVVGAGVFGLLHTEIAKRIGAKKVLLINRSQPKLEYAIEKGIIREEEAILADEDLVINVLAKTSGRGADVVIMALNYDSSVDALEKAVDYVADGGLINLWGGYKSGDLLKLNSGEVIDCYQTRSKGERRTYHTGRKTIEITGVRGADVQDFSNAISMLYKKDIEANKVISHVISLDTLPEVFGLIARGEKKIKGATVNKIIVDMRLEGDRILTFEEYKRLFPEAESDSSAIKSSSAGKGRRAFSDLPADLDGREGIEVFARHKLSTEGVNLILADDLMLLMNDVVDSRDTVDSVLAKLKDKGTVYQKSGRTVIATLAGSVPINETVRKTIGYVIEQLSGRAGGGLKASSAGAFDALNKEILAAQDILLKANLKELNEGHISQTQKRLDEISAKIQVELRTKLTDPKIETLFAMIRAQEKTLEYIMIAAAAARVGSDGQIIFDPTIIPDAKQRQAVVRQFKKVKAALEGSMSSEDKNKASTQVCLLEDILSDRVKLAENAILISNEQKLDGAKLLKINGGINEENSLFVVPYLVALARGLLSINDNNYSRLIYNIDRLYLKITKQPLDEALKQALKDGSYNAFPLIIDMLPGVEAVDKDYMERLQRQAWAALIAA